MSYYFVIVGTQDNPLFEYEFGTSKAGGDGQPRFPEQARHMNQFIVHSSLDIVEEVQWGTGQMYLKCIDRFFNNYVSCFVTGGNVKFMLLHQPPSSAASSVTNPRSSTSTIATNPTSPQTEEAVRAFMLEVYESWVKAIMSPFYRVNMEVGSPVFRQRVAAAGRKYL
ncbi:putative trafficking protein particle complex subunit 2 [Rosellinia necatrix]|uniref:Putative trafficking protein particle complex subunit 2 n=1 Tax=Rosellinia necatrix TaxID=77044 RepID=A0A1W2TMU6_ROSNE|nr:putative trafficking protein particle complex subunit 2 [Rosellinia necatrix]